MILLVGALAIGGKGLNFGIDFESGTRVKTSLVADRRRRTQIRDVLQRRGLRGRRDPEGHRRHELGSDGFQISLAETGDGGRPDQGACWSSASAAPRTSRRSRSARRSARRSPSSAIIAIIASLLVISAYIALRFEWKFAVPVLIALMHDLLITGGVYSLDRPGGDDVDGRGAADDPGLLALRHDHRVRPNPRERAADAARGVLADRQPLDERGADALAGDVVLRAAAGARAAASSAARRSRTSRSRCSSASPRAPTRRSSSPRRCSRTGRSARRSTAAAARGSPRRTAAWCPPYATDGARASTSTPTERKPRAGASPRRRIPSSGVSQREFQELVARHRSTRRADAPAAEAERRPGRRRRARGPRDEGRAQAREAAQAPRNRKHGRNR